MKYINTFDTQTEYEESDDILYPNVSYVKATEKVQWNRRDPAMFTAVYHVDTAPLTVRITYNQQYFSKIVIDGEEQTIGEYTLNYRFMTAGDHEVKFKAVDPSFIGNQAFYQCTAMTSVQIPTTCTEIYAGAFYGCSNLETVLIPKSLTAFGNTCFSECSKLSEIFIPRTVTSIGSQAFFRTGLESVDMPDSVTNLGDGAFTHCHSLTQVRLPESLASLGARTFMYCDALESITIPDSVTSIGVNCFDSCTALESVSLGDGMTSIGDNAFPNCTSLLSVIMPSTVTSIGAHAFYGDTAMTTVVLYSVTPPTLGDNRVFQYGSYNNWQNINCTFHVPSASVQSYKTATNWTGYANQIQAVQ